MEPILGVLARNAEGVIVDFDLGDFPIATDRNLSHMEINYRDARLCERNLLSVIRSFGSDGVDAYELVALVCHSLTTVADSLQWLRADGKIWIEGGKWFACSYS